MAAPVPTATPEPTELVSDTVIKSTVSPEGTEIKATTVSSTRGFFGSLLASTDMTVDSLILSLLGSSAAYWFLCGWIIIKLGKEIDPLTMGGGYAALLVAFAGGKTVRDKFSPGGGQG